MRFLIALVLLLGACSIPNLEDPQCTAARTSVREFYSFHFGNDMKMSPENLKLREKFLSPELYRTLSAKPAGDTDYFTETADLPKTFRVGTCKAESPDKAIFQVVLFWKTETRSEQRSVNVEAVKENDSWLINKVSN